MDEVGERNDMVWVEGKGYVRKAKAHAYAALGLKVHWETAEPDPNATARLPYKDD
jgi:hypothetical protein